jgi:putative transposase
MPWKETSPMDERRLFIKYVTQGEVSMSELCRVFEISRETGYKWRRRYEEEGEAGLRERSRTRHTHPNQTKQRVADLLLECRRNHPSWGPKKLVAFLEPRFPSERFPALSTVGEILKRNRIGPYTQPLKHATGPNAVWCVDFKGQFRTRDGKYCYPLTLSDAYSRFLLRCDSFCRTDFTTVRWSMQRAFLEFGMPAAVRSDNGPPFASLAPGGISRFAVMLIQLGVRPERIEPGKPTQNGRHERLHRTLKQETTLPPERNRLAQQRRFDTFRAEYNDERPHEALGQKTPASVYEASARPHPGFLADPEYDEDFETKRARSDGSLVWRGHHIPLTDCLATQLLGLSFNPEDQSWDIHFGPLRLGTLMQNGRFQRAR